MTAYINLTTQEYPRHQGDIELNPNDTYVKVEWVDMPAYDAQTTRCEEGFPVKINSIWCMTWIVRDATPEEINLANKPLDIPTE